MLDPDYDLFVAIVDAGSISAAARAHRLSVASASKRLQRLEARLGARLLHRTTRTMAITPEGDTLYRALVDIRGALAAVEARVSGRLEAIAGPLRLTAPTAFGRLYLGRCLAEFGLEHPAVDLEIDLADDYVDMTAGQFDLAIRISPPPPSSLVSYRLGPSPRVLCAAPSYLARRGVPERLEDLARHDVLATDGQLPWRLSSASGHVVHRGRRAVRTNSSEIVRELALAGMGIALRSLWEVSREIGGGALARVLPGYEGSHDAGIYVVHTPAPRVPAAMNAMIRHLERAFVTRAHLLGA